MSTPKSILDDFNGRVAISCMFHIYGTTCCNSMRVAHMAHEIMRDMYVPRYEKTWSMQTHNGSIIVLPHVYK